MTITRPSQPVREQHLKGLFIEAADLLNDMSFAGRSRQAKELKVLLNSLNEHFTRAVRRSGLHREI